MAEEPIKPGFAGTATFGSFSGRSPLGGSPAYSFVSSKAGTSVNTSASYRTSCNVYCHGQWPGANGSINPSWIITDGSQSACGTCHGATAANPPATGKHATHAASSAGNYGFSCTKCHPNPGGFSHVNGSVQWRLSSSTTGLIGSSATYTPNGGTAAISGQTNAIAPSSVYGTCNNIYCHSTAQGSNGTSTGIVYTAPKWSDAALGCGGCHADMAGASGTGDHVKHATTYGFTCNTCHGNSYTSSSITTATHVDRYVDLKFTDSAIATGTTYNTKGTRFLAGSAAYSSCNTSYCHSNGQSDGAKAPIYRQPTWGTTTTNCGSCHNNMATFANATSGSHTKHANTTTGYGMSCALCHGSSYTAASVPTGAGSTHVNKQINLAFTGTAAGTTYGKTSPFAPGSGAYDNCSNSYCHSNGQSDNARAAIKRTVAWGGTVTCGSYHNNMKTFVNVTSGSHKMHAQGNANYDCVICHSGYTATTVTQSTHADGKINLGFTSTGLNTVYSKYSAAGFAPGKGQYGTCSKSSCHGAGKPLWGNDSTRPECEKCHGSLATTYANFSAAQIAPGYGTDGRDTAGNTAATSAHVGAHQTHLVAPEAITNKIHCGECHTVHTTVTDATHLNYTTATMTFGPLAKTNAATPSVTRTSGVMTCNNTYCHGAKMPGGDTTGANKAPAWNVTGYLPATLTAPGSCNVCHGFPPSTAAGHPAATAPSSFPTANCNCHADMSTTGNTYGTIFGANANLHINGIVEVSGGHEYGFSGSKHMPGGTGSITANAAAPYSACSGCHNTTGTGGTYPVTRGSAANILCSSCHKNMTNFTGATPGCYDCHGSSATNGQPNGAATAFPNWSGAHPRHIAKSYVCDDCHKNAGAGKPTHGNYSGILKTRNDVVVSFNSTKAGIAAAYTAANLTCSNTYCHSNGQSDNAKARIYRQPVWSATVMNCGSCHTNMKTFANATSGSHKMHAQGNPNYDCAMCHNGYTATTANVTTHVDGKINLGFTSTALNTVYSKYSAAGFATAKGQYGTCSKSSCHGAGKPLWGNDTTRPECEKCHGSIGTTYANFSSAQIAPGYGTDGRDTAGNTAATSARVGAHQTHLTTPETISDKVHCGECHTTHTTVTDATHLNYTTATMTFGPLAKSNAATPSVARTSGVISCSNTYCHGAKMPGGDTTGLNKAPAWNATGYLPATLTAPGSCNTCHGFPPSTASGHPTATAPSSFPTGNCNCHANISTTGSSYSTIFVDRTKHINGIYEPAASGCKGCHGTGSVKDMQTEFARNSHHINKTWANITDADCVVCHAEGTISGGTVSVVSNRHGNDTGTKGVVDLYNADTRTTIYTITLTDLTAKTAAGNTANATLDTFCFSCHDSNGAAGVTTANGFSASNTATNPFSEVVGTSDLRNAYDQVQKSFGAAPAPLNVYDAFATTNNSNHAVRAARYTTATLSTPYQSLKQAGLLSTTVQVFSGQGTAGVADNSQLHCNDCHSTGYSAHGSANEYLLQTATEENPTVEHLALTSYVCQKCHSSTVYTTSGTHVGNSSDYQPQSNTTAVGSARLSNTAKGKGHITGIACLNCHDGNVGFGGIHGFPNATYVDGDTHTTNKRRFMPGSGLYKYSPSKATAGDGGWDMATPDNQCYTIGTATSMSACTQHSGGTAAGARNVRRPVTY